MPETRTQTLAEFLLACFADDEETARRASVTSVAESRPPQGRWWSEWRDEDADQERGFQPRTFGIMEGMTTLADVDADSGPGERGSAVAEHIVRHDPTRVLLECEAKRRIVELHSQDEHDCVEMHHGVYPSDWPVEAAWGKAGEPWAHPSLEHHVGPCPTLLALAQPYADHDGFREEWRL